MVHEVTALTVWSVLLTDEKRIKIHNITMKLSKSTKLGEILQEIPRKTSIPGLIHWNQYGTQQWTTQIKQTLNSQMTLYDL